jgi:hypothetical protein
MRQKRRAERIFPQTARRGMRVRSLVVAIAALFMIAACSAAAGPIKVQRSSGSADCTWGASSITASYVNGDVVEAEPQTSGCTSSP